MPDNIITLKHLQELALRSMADTTSKVSELTTVVTESFAEMDTEKQDKLTFDTTPIEGSANPVTSGGVYKAIGDINSVLDSINGEVV